MEFPPCQLDRRFSGSSHNQKVHDNVLTVLKGFHKKKGGRRNFDPVKVVVVCVVYGSAGEDEAVVICPF